MQRLSTTTAVMAAAGFPGHFGKAGAEGLILDTRRLTDIAKEKFPGLPLYLFGHSMGSLVSRCYLKRYDRELSGLFLCGTPYTAPAAVRAGKALISLKILLHGDTRRDAQINRLVTGAFNRSVPNAASPTSGFRPTPKMLPPSIRIPYAASASRSTVSGA